MLPDAETLQREADDFRAQLDSDKKYLDQLEAQFRKQRADADEFLKMTASEIAEWSEALVGGTEDSKRAAAILDLQVEWLDRFGRDATFHGALCERSSGVAATCVGLASLTGSTDVIYDICIFDEASKATATEALVPMVRAKKWIFVGDSRQLPPFEDEVHRNGELLTPSKKRAPFAGVRGAPPEISLFRFLLGAFPKLFPSLSTSSWRGQF